MHTFFALIVLTEKEQTMLYTPLAAF